MELSAVNQGVQNNFNNTVKSLETSTGTNNIKVSTGNNGLNNDTSDYTEKQIKDAINKINKFLKSENTYAEYSVHEKLGRIMVKIVDQDTKEVLLECPPKKVVDLVANMMELTGVIVDEKA